jgi:hypothetical protein
MDAFQSALDVVLDRLKEMRDGGGRWPRASRASLEALRRIPVAAVCDRRIGDPDASPSGHRPPLQKTE